VCIDFGGNAAKCQLTSDIQVPCSGPPSCQATITIQSCYSLGDTCTPSNETLTYSCWGSGDTPTPMPSYGNIAIAPSVGVPFASTVSGILSLVIRYTLLQ
jgi:hypothetical protein